MCVSAVTDSPCRGICLGAVVQTRVIQAKRHKQSINRIVSLVGKHSTLDCIWRCGDTTARHDATLHKRPWLPPPLSANTSLAKRTRFLWGCLLDGLVWIDDDTRCSFYSNHLCGRKVSAPEWYKWVTRWQCEHREGGLFVSFHGVGEGKDEPWFWQQIWCFTMMRVSVRGFSDCICIEYLVAWEVVRSELVWDWNGYVHSYRGCVLYLDCGRVEDGMRNPCWALRGFDNLFGVWGSCEDEVWVWWWWWWWWW